MRFCFWNGMTFVQTMQLMIFNCGDFPIGVAHGFISFEIDWKRQSV
jgi:hypothetical protein